MKKRFRRMASWLCVLALCLGFLPGTALADGDSPEESGAPAECTMTEGCEATEHEEGCPAAVSNENGIELYDENEEETEDTSYVAQIVGGSSYSTLAGAISAANNGAEIKLTKNTTESITIASEKEIVLDLNGYTLTNTASSHTITNNGTLTIKDSVGGGKVDNVSHGKGALVNNAGGKVTLEGGKLTRSAEAGSSSTDNGGNSWYVVDNHGTLNVTGGKIVNTSKHSSLIRNLGTMNVSGGTIQQNDFIAIKNDEAASQSKYGELSITGGTIISNEQAIQNWQEAEISGGTINGPVYTWGYESGSTALGGETKITGGTINGDIGIAVDTNYPYSNSTERPSVSISGDADITGNVVTNTSGTEGTVTISGVIIDGSVANSAKTSFIISDGAVITGNVTSGADGKTTVADSTVQGTVDGNSIVVNSTVNGELTTQAPENVAAIIGTTTYETLAAAVQAAESGDTVTLLKDVKENITIGEGQKIVLDLNGCTLNGGTESKNAALTNNGTITIRDTSEKQTGTIMREDTGGSGSYYTILNNFGTMTIESGTVKNESGLEPPEWGGASLVCNGPSQKATLIIKGGTFAQKNFIAIKNDEYGTLTIEDATIESDTQAVQNWCDATISGGTLTGDVTTWTYNDTEGETKITGGTITGDLLAVKYSTSATNKPSVAVSGDPTIEGSIIVGINDAGGIQINEDGGIVAISGGSFSESVSEYVVDSLKAELNSNGVYTYYSTVEEALKNAQSGDTITDLSGSGETPPGPVTVYTVTYLNDGTTYSVEKVTDGTEIMLAQGPSKDGYVFTGWSNDAATYQPNAILKVTSNLTLTAQWERKATVIEPVYVRYIVEHWLEGRRDYELEETESFIGKIDEIVTAQPKDYPGYRYNASISTASGKLTEINGEDDIVVLKLYYDERTTSRPSGGGSEPSYTVSVEDVDHGEITVSPKRAQEGDEVTVTATPDEGYELDILTVTDKDGDELRLTENRDGTFSFEMPASRVTIEATFVPVEEPVVTTPVTWTNPFTDVATGAWYYDAVGYVYTNGVMTGVTPTAFSPDTTTTRAQIWTLLARLNGQNVEGGSPWYAAAQQWAISAGVSDGTDPDAPITREQLAAMLYRAAGSPAVSGNLLAYPDGNAVSPWAESAMLWATQNGIITGIDGALTPQGSATRAQVAAMLTRAQ